MDEAEQKRILIESLQRSGYTEDEIAAIVEIAFREPTDVSTA